MASVAQTIGKPREFGFATGFKNALLFPHHSARGFAEKVLRAMSSSLRLHRSGMVHSRFSKAELLRLSVPGDYRHSSPADVSFAVLRCLWDNEVIRPN